MKKIAVLSMVLLFMGIVVAANAAPFCYQVGDVDGYGAGYPDQGLAGWVAPIYDGRSAAEAAATDGAQLTDSYSTLFPGNSPGGINAYWQRHHPPAGEYADHQWHLCRGHGRFPS